MWALHLLQSSLYFVMYSIFRQFKIRTDNSFYFCAGTHVVGTQETRQQKGWYYETRSFFSKNSASVKSMNSFFSLSSPTQIATKNWNWVETWEGRGGERCLKCWIAQSISSETQDKYYSMICKVLDKQNFVLIDFFGFFYSWARWDYQNNLRF